MVGFYGIGVSGAIGDDGDSEALHVHVACDDNFWHGGHADGVPSDDSYPIVFGWSFERGALKAGVDAFSQGNVELASGFFGELNQPRAIGVRHCGEAGTKFVDVLAS